MVVTADQADQISQLAIVNTTRKAAQNMLKDDPNSYRDVLGHSHHVRLTNPKIVDELWHRAHAQKVDTKDIIEDILWRAFFPNETQGQKTANMVRACPSLKTLSGSVPIFMCNLTFQYGNKRDALRKVTDNATS